MSVAVWLGNFIGAVLAQCAPVLVKILSEAIQNARFETVEESNAPDDLRKRLLERLHSYRASAGRNPVADQATSDSEGVAIRQRREESTR